MVSQPACQPPFLMSANKIRQSAMVGNKIRRGFWLMICSLIPQGLPSISVSPDTDLVRAIGPALIVPKRISGATVP